MCIETTKYVNQITTIQHIDLVVPLFFHESTNPIFHINIYNEILHVHIFIVNVSIMVYGAWTTCSKHSVLDSLLK